MLQISIEYPTATLDGDYLADDIETGGLEYGGLVLVRDNSDGAEFWARTDIGDVTIGAQGNE